MGAKSPGGQCIGLEVAYDEQAVCLGSATVIDAAGEAAKILGIGLPQVKKLMDRNTEPLRLFLDTAEPNPTRNKRLLRDEVMADRRRVKR